MVVSRSNKAALPLDRLTDREMEVFPPLTVVSNT
ncbi:MAG: hypothetical protein JWN51_3801 [Phycisphaerales bacterium]|nr:hypothetical protein [Phycisphaerales bacterium]